jgi:cobalamin biosynthesis protein CobT
LETDSIMANDKFLKKLKGAQKHWGKASKRAAEAKGGFDEVDDGRYVARCQSMEVGESKSSGRLQAITTYKIMEGDFKGATCKSFDGLETEDNLVYVARNLGRFGYEVPEDIEQILDIFEEVTKSKPLCRINLKTRGEYQNVYLDKVFDPADEAEVLEEAAAEEGGGDDGDEEVAEEDAAEEVAEDGDEEVTEDGDEEVAEEDEEVAEEEVAEDEDAAELEVGARVEVEGKGLGSVTEIDEDEGKAKVKIDETGKVFKVAFDKLTLADEEVEEVPEEPVKPPKATKPAKPAPAPAKPAKPAPKPVRRK